MKLETRAVIDVGTNSVKLLVADVADGNVFPLHEESEQTRLGKGLYETGMLSPDAIADTAAVVGQFRTTAEIWGSGSLRVVATSAAREALNRGELLLALEEAGGRPVEVLSGEEEAILAFQGVATDGRIAAERLLVMDLGGGSTEFILGSQGNREFAQSYPLGVVRLLEAVRPADPPTGADRARCRQMLEKLLAGQIAPALATHLAKPALLVGSGGTTTILAKIELGMDGFDRDTIENLVLARPDVDRLADRLWNFSLAERRQIAGLPPKRADVILAGVAICSMVMHSLKFDSLRVSTRGLRFAAALGS